jgi:glyoxylase-like metal-dependent hydrolase (beta-lactamase superfamily II)
VRAVSLHRDVLVVTSALLQVNCVIVRGGVEKGAALAGAPPVAEASVNGETFVIDSPVLPDELDALPALLEQAGFAAPSGLLATHGDWDHLLGTLAFPGVAVGCAESTVQRLSASPGEAQRALRGFDEELMIERPRPLTLGSLQALPVPGRCEIGDRELELHPADGHTPDGMVAMITWADVLVAGDYLSTVELPMLSEGGRVDRYLATLERLAGLISRAKHIVPGHGPVLDRARALALLGEDAHYLRALAELGGKAELPAGRRGPANRLLHQQNLGSLQAGTSTES